MHRKDFFLSESPALSVHLKDRRIEGYGWMSYMPGLIASVTKSLATLNPEIADQWHPTQNGDLTPVQVVARSGRNVWWKCSEGPDHEWPARLGRPGLCQTLLFSLSGYLYVRSIGEAVQAQ